MQENLKKLSELHLSKCTDKREKERYLLINKILQDNECFKKMKTETAYKLLNDLGFKLHELKKVYNELIFNN